MYEQSKRSFSAKLFLAVSILPFLILYCAFMLYPLLKGLFYSFYIWSGVTNVMKFVGLRNYYELFSDPIVLLALKNDFIILFSKEILILIPAFFIAVALTRLDFKQGEKTFYRVIFYFPNIVSIVIIALVWSFIYHPSIGILNSALNTLGLGNLAHAWLGEAETVIPAIIPVTVWAGIGFYAILFIAGIQGISADLFEAAILDGAGQWKQFTYITIPMIWNHIKFAIISIMFTTLSGNFAFIQIMTNGGPDNASQVLGFYMWEQAFKLYRVGYSTAIGVFILVIAVIITFTSEKLSKVEID